MPAGSNHILRRLWRLFGFVSTVTGLLCYALSSSFNHLFGHWNLLKIFLYVTFSFTILFITWFGKVRPFLTTISIMFKIHIPILVLLGTSVYSVFYDKAVNQKPDAFILISCAAFSVMCLCLSKQTQIGCEVDLLNCFLGFLIVLLMKTNLWLFFVGAAFSYSLHIIRSCSDITLQSGDFELFQNHLAIPLNYLFQLLGPQHANSDSATELYLEQANEMPIFIKNENYAQVQSLLSESGEFRVIGIWGMGGAGKTAAARAVFNEISSQFECTCFLSNVSEELRIFGLNYIRHRLFSELLKDNDLINTNTDSHIAMIMSRLKDKKVLVVLDDVNSSEQFDFLVGVMVDSLGAGSRVILTSRDRHALIRIGAHKIHEVTVMNDQDSLQLFSLYAFNKTHPEMEYEELSKRAAAYANGYPLALKVLGSYFYVRSKDKWESTLSKLQKIRNNTDIHDVLKSCYDDLDETDKHIFLESACFFEGHDRDQVIKVLDACGFFAEIRIRNLLDKALTNIDLNNCIKMHSSLVQQMGYKIVRQESIQHPGQPSSRLWHFEDVMDVLINNGGTLAVESIILDLTQIADLPLSAYDAFRNMPNLKLLALFSDSSLRNNKAASIPRVVELPPNLLYLQWDWCPLRTLPSVPFEKLVCLSMPHSNVQKLWDGPKNMPFLKIIYLAFSEFLIECPDLTGASNLESVSFLGCESLDHLHPSIFSLQKLQELDVSGCTTLKNLCSKTCSPSLRRLHSVGCTNLHECSITTPDDQCKTHLHMKFE